VSDLCFYPGCGKPKDALQGRTRSMYASEKSVSGSGVKKHDRRRIPGTLVKMSASLKKRLPRNGSALHLKEFGDCVGAVIGPMFPAYPEYEVDVRWHPSGLRYGYMPETDLVLFRGKIK
jgi:hypothetical protein